MPKTILQLTELDEASINSALMSQAWVGVDFNNESSLKMNLLEFTNFILASVGTDTIVSGGQTGGSGGGGGSATPAYDPATTLLMEDEEPLLAEDGTYLLLE